MTAKATTSNADYVASEVAGAEGGEAGVPTDVEGIFEDPEREDSLFLPHCGQRQADDRCRADDGG